MVLLIMGWLGYVSEKGTVGQTPETAMNMCWLVAGLYLFSAVLMFIGIAFIYNLDKKSVDKMTADLGARNNVNLAETAEAVDAPVTMTEEAAEATDIVEETTETPAEEKKE